jgi:hypothetical protein
MLGIDRAGERFGPEAGGSVDIVGLAIDQNAVDARAMYVSLLWRVQISVASPLSARPPPSSRSAFRF